MGDPKGQAELLKLDAFRDDISTHLKKGINKWAIAKLIECSPSTLYQWLKRRHTAKNIKQVIRLSTFGGSSTRPHGRLEPYDGKLSCTVPRRAATVTSCSLSGATRGRCKSCPT